MDVNTQQLLSGVADAKANGWYQKQERGTCDGEALRQRPAG